MVGLKRGFECFPNPVIADEDGLELLPYSPGQAEKCIGPDGNMVRLLNLFRPVTPSYCTTVRFAKGICVLTTYMTTYVPTFSRG